MKSNQQTIKIDKYKITKKIYRKHQENIIKNFSNRKGMILFHSVGSGKTIIALGIYKQIVKMKNIKLLVICPDYIKSSWLRDLDKIGVSRQTTIILDYDKAIFSKKNYKDYMIIIDEAHNLEEYIKNKKYKNGIDNLLNCYKIVLLTATPIKYNITDLSYLVNFAAKKNILPYNPDEFREKYMKINKYKRLLFGYIFPYTPEILQIVLTFFAGFVMKNPNYFKERTAIATKILILIATTIFSIFSPHITFNTFFELDSEKMKKITKEYISYYEVDENDKNYPKKKQICHNVSYNLEQYSILLNYSNQFYEPKLDDIILDLSKISKDVKNSSKNVKIKTDNIMNYYNKYQFPEEMLSNLTGIGNVANSNKIEELVQFISSNQKENHVIYSKFYNNGIKILQKKLNEKNIKHKILENNMNLKQMNNMLENFKLGKINVLLIHPELIEGYEIHGVRNFHILEPISDLSIYTQIKGRAYRYRSHAHLPLNQREITYHLWFCDISPVKIAQFVTKIYSSQFSFIKKYLISPRYIIDRLLLKNHPITPDQRIIENIKYSIEDLEDIKKQLL